MLADDALSSIQPAAAFPFRRQALLRWSIALGLVAVAAFAGYQAAWQAGLARLREVQAHRLDMLASELDADLTRFDYLPALLETTPFVPALLDTPQDDAQRDTVNRYLFRVNATVGAEMLYVLNARGQSLAASDWDQPGTTVGQDLSFRPYVRDALEHGQGRFYGMGITSHKPGYYLSYALHDGRMRGIVAVKVNIEAAERAWRKLPGNVLLLDEHGVIILSSRDELKFRPLAPLDAGARAEVERSRPYGDAKLQPLGWRVMQALDAGTQIVALDASAGSSLASTRTLRRPPWQLVVLDDLKPARAAARYAAVTAALAMAVLLLVAVALWQRRRAMQQKLASRAALQAAHDSLESTVIARTAELRTAQNELVHAGKMAALGQMSARMVHELNQPLTAIRTLSDNAVILLDQQRADEVRGNLRRIADMVGRLARLTSQLKTFAHKDGISAKALPLSRSIADAQGIIGAALREHGVRVEIDIEPTSLAAMAEEEALGSVLVNLMRNAIDALADAPRRVLRIEARARDGRVLVSVSDTGPGIREDILPRLFEPFVTSKPAGAGLGLGLVISAQQLRAFGGTLRAANCAAGGACFTIDLPMPPLQE